MTPVTPQPEESEPQAFKEEKHKGPSEFEEFKSKIGLLLFHEI